MFARMDMGGGGGDLFELLKNLPSANILTASSSNSISVTNGKHYLVVCCACAASATTTVVSGGTVAWEVPISGANALYTATSNSRLGLLKMCLVTATASTLEVQFGSNTNARAYVAIQLD